MTCPHCGFDVPAGAVACRECGSDMETGWSEDANHFAGGIPTGHGPDDEFDYNEFVNRDLPDSAGSGNSSSKKPRYDLMIVFIFFLYVAIKLFMRFL